MGADPDTKTQTTETTPLLSGQSSEQKSWGKPVVYLILLCGFAVSLSFSVTQVPLIYVFNVMTCDAYYENHPEPGLEQAHRCNIPAIQAGTARAVSLLGASTTFFGVSNLFFTGWSIKRFGVKAALVIQVFWPAVRLAIQNVGVMIGSTKGIIIVQSSQVVSIIGGPAGYMLALNNFITEVVDSRERTGFLGRLQGCNMFGMALGFLMGGIISDKFGILAPFRVTLALFLSSSLYALLFLPSVPRNKEIVTRTSKGFTKFFGPLKMFIPQRWIRRDGRTFFHWGTFFLGGGAFFGVLATGYVATLLQMYATDVFDFGTSENSLLISLHLLTRGLFLMFLFPRIISAGRKRLERRSSTKAIKVDEDADSAIPDIPAEPNNITAPQELDQDEEPTEPPKRADDQETFEFDLLFTKCSLLTDGILTALATFVGHGWQLFVVALVLPFASGTGSAAKGTILQMCTAAERTDALSAITLLEMIARLATTSIFGVVFAALAEIEKTYLIFTCNGAIALLGFVVVVFARFPPDGSQRLGQEQIHNASDGANE